MSKHVHPTLFRRGYPSILSEDVKNKVSKKGLKVFERKDSYTLNANVKYGLLGRKIRQCFSIEEVLRELLQKSGCLVESVTLCWDKNRLIINVSLYHRASTSLAIKTDGVVVHGVSDYSRFKKRGRRPEWTVRTTQWRSLCVEDLNFYKRFLAKYFDLKEGQLVVNMQVGSMDELRDSSCYQGLLLTLQPLQKQVFFHDLVSILCRASKEPSAELLVRLLQVEVGHLRNQQVMLDGLSQGLQYILQLENSILKAFLIKVSGRINGSDRAKVYQSRQGSIPLHTLKAPIDYAFAEVNTKYGIISLKIYLRY